MRVAQEYCIERGGKKIFRIYEETVNIEDASSDWTMWFAYGSKKSEFAFLLQGAKVSHAPKDSDMNMVTWVQYSVEGIRRSYLIYCASLYRLHYTILITF